MAISPSATYSSNKYLKPFHGLEFDDKSRDDSSITEIHRHTESNEAILTSPDSKLKMDFHRPIDRRADRLHKMIESSSRLPVHAPVESPSKLDDFVTLNKNYPQSDFMALSKKSREDLSKLLHENPKLTLLPSSVSKIIESGNIEMARRLEPQIKACIMKHSEHLANVWKEVADVGDDTFMFLFEKGVLPCLLSDKGKGSPLDVLSKILETGNYSVATIYLNSIKDKLTDHDFEKLIQISIALGNLELLKLLVNQRASHSASSSRTRSYPSTYNQIFELTLKKPLATYETTKSQKALEALKVRIGWYFLSSPVTEVENLIKEAISRYQKDPELSKVLQNTLDELHEWGGMIARRHCSSYNQVVSDAYHKNLQKKPMKEIQQEFLRGQMQFGSSSFESVCNSANLDSPSFIEVYQNFALWRSEQAGKRNSPDSDKFRTLRILAPIPTEESMCTESTIDEIDEDSDSYFPGTGDEFSDFSDDDFSDDELADFSDDDLGDYLQMETEEGNIPSRVSTSLKSSSFHPKIQFSTFFPHKADNWTPVFPRNPKRYGHFLRRAWGYREKIIKNSPDAPQDLLYTKPYSQDSKGEMGNELELTYTIRSTGTKISITEIGRVNAKPYSNHIGWTHSKGGLQLERLLDDLEIIHKEIMDMKADKDDPASINKLHKKIAEGFWVLANTMPTNRGNGHISLMMLHYWYRHHGFTPPIPSIKVGQIDGMAISIPLSEFVKPEVFLSMFDKPAQPKTK